MDWDALRYRQFEAERNRPAADLIARAGDGPARRVVDLGCGPGNSTELLAERFPHADLLGLDTSPDMLAAARARLPGARFERADVAAWAGGPAELIFANAVLHWVPDHIAVMARLVGELASGGRLAAQMPDNADEPTHRLMREVAAEPIFRDKLAAAGEARESIPGFRAYVEALEPLVARLDLWRTVYVHRLPDAGAIVRFVEGAGLRPYLAPLGEGERARFLERYGARIAEAYPPLACGGVLLPFPRLFVVAYAR